MATVVALDNNSRALLQSLITKTCKLLNKDVEDTNTLETIEALLISTIRTPSRSVIGPGQVGSIAPGFRSFTIINEGSTNAIVNGETFFPGISETYDAGGQSDVLAGMTYDTQLTTLVIITIQ